METRFHASNQTLLCNVMLSRKLETTICMKAAALRSRPKRKKIDGLRIFKDFGSTKTASYQ